MDFKELALEFVKIYYPARRIVAPRARPLCDSRTTCYPGNLPEDKEKAFQEINQIYGKYKAHLIDKATKQSEDFFKDKF